MPCLPMFTACQAQAKRTSQTMSLSQHHRHGTGRVYHRDHMQTAGRGRRARVQKVCVQSGAMSVTLLVWVNACGLAVK